MQALPSSVSHQSHPSVLAGMKGGLRGQGRVSGTQLPWIFQVPLLHVAMGPPWNPGLQLALVGELKDVGVESAAGVGVSGVWINTFW